MPTTDRRARRLAIARRRERIAAQPRVGDVIDAPCFVDYRRIEVVGVYSDHVTTRVDGLYGRLRYLYPRWRELVRRARRTQEGSAHE